MPRTIPSPIIILEAHDLSLITSKRMRSAPKEGLFYAKERKATRPLLTGQAWSLAPLAKRRVPKTMPCEFNRNTGFRIQLTNTFFGTFPGILSRRPVVPNSRVFRTPHPFQRGGTFSPAGSSPSKPERKSGSEIGGRKSEKMADFSALMGRAVSLYVPLRKTTQRGARLRTALVRRPEKAARRLVAQRGATLASDGKREG